MNHVIRLLLVFALLFGSVGMPAIADSAEMSHAIEMIDTDCHNADAQDDDRQDPGQQPTQHIDHHHCSVGLKAEQSFAAQALFATSERKRPMADEFFDGFKPGPLTEPPAA